MNRSQAGAYIKTVDVETQYVPGNFGVRVIETIPINLSDIWRERKTTHLGTLFFEEHFKMPEQLQSAIQEDYPTDEEDEADAKNLNQKVPDLTDLINDFEKEDEVLKQGAEASR